MAKILMFKTESKRVIGRQVVRFIYFIKWGLAEKMCLVFMTILCRNEICVIFNGKFILKNIFHPGESTKAPTGAGWYPQFEEQKYNCHACFENILWN